MNRRAASLAVALCMTLASAAPAAADVVTIGSTLSPVRARIVAGGKVRWENTTAGPQRVDSVNRPGFEDLAIPAGGSGERRFARPGRYRYRAPGIGKDGEVIVRAAGRRPRPSPGPGSRSRGRDCDRRDVFLYDVRVLAGKSGSETWIPLFRNSGQFSFSYSYSVLYPRVPVTVSHRCAASSTVSSPGSDSSSGGGNPGSATLASYRWRDSVVSQNPGQDGDVLPCGFNAVTAGLGAEIRISGSAPGPGDSGALLSMAGGLRPDQFVALSALLRARRDAVCDKGNPGLSNSLSFDGLGGHQSAGTVPIFEKPLRAAGLSIEPPSLGLNGEFTTYSIGFPTELRKLVRGDSFSVYSGHRTYRGTNGQTTARAAVSVRIDFNRAR